MYQFSLRTLFIAMLMCGLTCAAIELRSALLTGIAQSLHAGALALALVGVWCGREDRRIFCFAYFVFGLAYSLSVFPDWRLWNTSSGQALAFWSHASNATGGRVSISPNPTMLTYQLIELYAEARPKSRGYNIGDYVEAQWTNGSWYSATIQDTEGGQALVAWHDGSAPLWVSHMNLRAFKRDFVDYQWAGHSVLAPFIGLWGGWLACAVFGNKKNSPPTTADCIPAVGAITPFSRPVDAAACGREGPAPTLQR